MLPQSLSSMSPKQFRKSCFVGFYSLQHIRYLKINFITEQPKFLVLSLISCWLAIGDLMLVIYMFMGGRLLPIS